MIDREYVIHIPRRAGKATAHRKFKTQGKRSVPEWIQREKLAAAEAKRARKAAKRAAQAKEGAE